MPFVAGTTLDVTARRLHEHSGDDGLQHGDLQDAMGHARDLTRILARFHSEGLWHKDIKPSNLIVGPTGLHVVDLGLVTPLASAMTLTTHGTEYYRDPELVRLAMKGVKVHQVNGAKFDIYGSGAVLYTLLEDSFPAHGSLSRFNRPSPKALQFVVRKAMADMDSRYGAAAHMTQDLEYLLGAEDVWSVQPADLPSYRGTLSPPMEVSHRAPATVQVPYRTMGGSDWTTVSSEHDDLGPVTRAAQAAGWNSPQLQGQRHLDRGTRRRKRRGPFKALALAGIGLLSITFYRAAFTNSFHDPAKTATHTSDLRLQPTVDLSDLDLIVTMAQLKELPPQSLILVAGPNKASARPLRREISRAGLVSVANDASLSSETSRNWIAGAQVQMGSSRCSDPATRVRLIAWQKVSAPELDALVWLTGDDLSRTEVLVFKAPLSSKD
jgi:serine/threonine protein kinase